MHTDFSAEQTSTPTKQPLKPSDKHNKLLDSKTRLPNGNLFHIHYSPATIFFASYFFQNYPVTQNIAGSSGAEIASHGSGSPIDPVASDSSGAIIKKQLPANKPADTQQKSPSNATADLKKNGISITCTAH